LNDSCVILTRSGAEHVDVMNVRNGQSTRVLSAVRRIIVIIALIDQNRVISINRLKVRECDVANVTTSAALDTSGAWIVREDFDACAVLGIRHDDVVDIDVLDDVGFAFILAKRANRDSVRAVT